MTIYVAIPSKTGMVPLEAQQCYIDIMNAAYMLGTRVRWATVKGNPYIQHVRNVMVADFLKTDCDELLFADDDLAWEQGAAHRLLTHDCDVVGGVYPKRQDKLEFTAKPAEPLPDANGIMEMIYIPAGFMRIRRHVLEKMVKHYSQLEYSENAGPDEPEKLCHALFWVQLRYDDDGKLKMMGEDVDFCTKWRDMGGKVYADTLLEFQHFGPHKWKARYAEHIPGFLKKIDEAA